MTKLGTPTVGLFLGQLLILLLVVGCAGVDEDATMTVSPQTLRHEVSAEGVLKASRVTPVVVPGNVRGRVRLAWLAFEGQRVEAGELVAQFDDSELLEKLTEGQADLRSSGYQVDKAIADQASEVAAIEVQRKVADLELEMAKRFQLTDKAVFSRHDIIESEIDGELAAARREQALADQESSSARAQTDLEILDINRGTAQRKVERAREGLESLEVRSPHAGLFLRARNWSRKPLEAGAELWAGQPVGEIPELSSLEVEVFVLEADAGGLATGKTADVVVEAHPEKVYTATITRVDTIAKPRFPASPVQYFGVTLSFDDPIDDWLKPGQRVRASLLLAVKEAVLAVPRQAVVVDGDSYRVVCLDNGAYVAREVQLGETATGLVEVTSGLESGDVVALDPTTIEFATAPRPDRQASR